MVACTALDTPKISELKSNILKNAIRYGKNAQRMIPMSNEKVRKNITGILETCPQQVNKFNSSELIPFIAKSKGT